MIRIALLGFGKVGQTVLSTIQQDPVFHNTFEVQAIWNRSREKVENHPLVTGIPIFESLGQLEKTAEQYDLVVECAHPDILIQSAVPLLESTNLFMSSPSALGHLNFKTEIQDLLERSTTQCYLPIGASIGIWDVIKLDQGNKIKNMTITMSKHPDSFKIKDKDVLRKLEEAKNSNQPVELIVDSIDKINRIAPQNTNTMTIYNLGAVHVPSDKKIGRLIADRNLAFHKVQLELETTEGLQLHLNRINPAGHGAVTGNATFHSFLNSLLHFNKGIRHNNFIFC